MQTYRIDYVNQYGVEQYVVFNAKSTADALNKLKDDCNTYFGIKEFKFIGEWRTTTYIEMKFVDDPETYTDYFESAVECFNKACYLKAFDDCAPIESMKVVVEGRVMEYCGWQPNLHYQWVDAQTGELMWDNYYGQWDH